MPEKIRDYSIYDGFMGIDTDMDLSKEFADEVDGNTEFELPMSEDPIKDFYKQYHRKNKF